MDKVAGIAGRRLHTQRLTGKPFASPVDAVRWLGAVQSQDYGGAKWALGQRTRGVTDAVIDRLYDEGAILRTHVMRPTWHFVVPEDIRWLLALTGPKIRRGLAGRYGRLELDDDTIARALVAFRSALARRGHMTRPELGKVLDAANISPAGQRLPHLLMSAELEGVIVSGPRRGKQHTYALLDERAPKGRAWKRAEAVAELTLRYFRSHGPAQVQDFVWWSGLTMADARAGIAAAGPALEHEVFEGTDLWSSADAPRVNHKGVVAHLLPNFDEYTVGYRDRAGALHPDHSFDPALFSFGSILSNIVTIDGRVRGAWRRAFVRDRLIVEIKTMHRMDRTESQAVEEAARRLGRFLGRPAAVSGL
ncbi:MAG TPA: winged helix DNA-binding domain-containing protein [Candidatus Dormibacteraeota bacterium]